jgi:hypothetical protein
VSRETLEITKLALLEIPDFTTVWNYRREILSALFGSAHTVPPPYPHKPAMQGRGGSSEATALRRGACLPGPVSDEEPQVVQRVAPGEASLLIKLEHDRWQRRWVLSVAVHPPLETELALCSKFLKFDERNCVSL